MDLAARAVQWLVAQHVTTRAGARSDVSLVDEGVVQALWSIGLRGDVEPVLAAVGTRRPVPPADLLVVASVSPELALERLTARRSQHSRTQSLTTTEMSEELRRGVRLLDRLVDWWTTAPGGPHEVFVVTGTEETSDDRDRLLQHVLAARSRHVQSCGSSPPPEHRPVLGSGSRVQVLRSGPPMRGAQVQVDDRHRPDVGPPALPLALHVCTRYQRGGSERRVQDLIRALPDLRHHLVLGAESDVDLAREQTGADQVWILPTLVRQVVPRRDAAALLSLWRLLRRGRYAVVVTHQSKAGVLARTAAAARGGPPTVHSLSMASFGPGYGRAENLLFPRLERALGRRTTAYCVVGNDLAQRFAEVGVPPDRLHVVRSGVPLPAEVPPRDQARRRLDERYGTVPGRPLICYVGSLEQRKNPLLLPRLLRRLHDRLPGPPGLLVVGDGPERGRLEDELRAQDLQGSVVLTGYLSDPARVHEALRGSDVVVLMSEAEGLPQVLVQAAAVGTPFVAFDVEGVREVLALGAAGSVVPLGSVEEAADEVARWLGAAEREPQADLSSWTRESITASYRSVVVGALTGHREAASSRRPGRPSD
ncbi:glycosyltransferase family 4 protein [Modestobacter sp. I12A-02662]|uniref:glycosyltransferase family 4 protein n=1 Tax=Modestobacter sp. I12A-02662 TaxID=1730496 RepID=UPI0034DEA044